jgi:hypothetical protein
MLTAMRTTDRPCALLAIPLSVGLGLAVTVASLAGEATPAEVTTDTPQYCLQLFDQVSQMVRVRASTPQEVTSLTTDGQRMCDQGKTRGGIMRLRRALVLLREDGQP